MSQAFYRKWRPHRWDEVVGQQHVIQTLRNAVVAERVAHAYLFAGPRGTGKTTAARLLAKAVNCLDPDLATRPCDQCEHCKAVNEARFLDLIEIDAASNTSVDDVRNLREKINYSPNQGRYKVYIIDEVHMLSTAAFNALLKTLEEPPPHAIFVLATTEVHKIPATVLSRCQRHEFRRIPVNEIITYLGPKAEEEGLQIVPEALKLIARQSTGCLRDAISLLDQLASTGETITLELTQVVLGTATSQDVFILIDALLSKQAATGLEQIHKTLDKGSDPRQFTRQVVDYLRDLLLVRMEAANQVDATPEVRQQMAAHAEKFTVPDLIRAIKIFNQAATEVRGLWQPMLPLEMAFVESMEAPITVAETTPSTQPARAITSGAGIKSHSAPTGKAAHVPPTSTPVTASVQVDEESKELFNRITSNWRQVVSSVRQRNPQTQALLNSCKLLGMRLGSLLLGFNNSMVKSKMETSENIEATRQAIMEHLGVDVRVQCVLMTSQRDRLPSDADSDGMVAAALDLGGKVAKKE